MNATAVAILVFALSLQAIVASPRELIGLARGLTGSEIELILGASRDAIAGRTVRISFGPGRSPLDVLMSPAGRPILVRSTSTIEGGIVGGVGRTAVTPSPQTVWREEVTRLVYRTGRPARRCDGSFAGDRGEMVIEYISRSSAQGWNVTARSSELRDEGGTGFSAAMMMLRGGTVFTSDERRELRSRPVRVFVSVWQPPSDGGPWEQDRIGDPTPSVIGEPVVGSAIQSCTLMRSPCCRFDGKQPSEAFSSKRSSLDTNRPTWHCLSLQMRLNALDRAHVSC